MNLKDRFSSGQGIGFFHPDVNGVSYGVVLSVSEKRLLYAPVFCAEYVICYDDENADLENKNNVRLKDCPPPFTKESDNIPQNVYAYADMNHPSKLSALECDMYQAHVIDNGCQISQRDMKDVLKHVWPEQFEKECTKTVLLKKEDVSLKKLQKRRLPAVADVLDDMEKDSGMEY